MMSHLSALLLHSINHNPSLPPRLTRIAHIGLIGLLWFTLSACGDIVRVVPADTPTPQPVQSAPLPAPSGIHRIVAQKIDLDAPVVEMGWRVIEQSDTLINEWEMPDNEAAWHQNSAKPGQGGNVVISGHNASTGGQVFAALDDLQVGDEVTLWDDQANSVAYQVVEKIIIRTFAVSDEALRLLRQATEPTPHEQLTLITCWPNWSNTHRLIVIAKPKQSAPENSVVSN